MFRSLSLSGATCDLDPNYSQGEVATNRTYKSNWWITQCLPTLIIIIIGITNLYLVYILFITATNRHFGLSDTVMLLNEPWQSINFRIAIYNIKDKVISSPLLNNTITCHWKWWKAKKNLYIYFIKFTILYHYERH